MQENVFICSDGQHINYRLWLPPKGTETKAFLQILHGMAEHSLRYSAFATYLSIHGIAVFCADMRGHGKSLTTCGPRGWVAELNGWSRLEEDAFELAYNVVSQYANGQDIYLFGHSLGSSLARTLLSAHPFFYSGAIFMGVSASMGFEGRMAMSICRREIARKGTTGQCEIMQKLMIGRFNRPFEPNETDFDWLSRDASEVYRYIADENCGFTCTAGFFRDMLEGIAKANDPYYVRKIPRYIPMLILCGSNDPVAEMGEGARKVASLYLRNGFEDVVLKLFPGARHELLKETNRAEVFSMVRSWLEERIAR